MSLDVWADLHFVGGITYTEYLNMDPDEARGCLAALQGGLDRARAAAEEAEKNRKAEASKPPPHAGFGDLVAKYQNAKMNG